MAQDVALVTIPAWLDPFWHRDFDVSSALAPAEVAEALAVPATRLGVRRSADGSLRVVRRGGFMNQFVRAGIALHGNGSGSVARVHMARPRWVRIFFVLTFVGLVAWPVLDVIIRAIFYPAAVFDQAIFAAIGVAIWVIVIGMNYTSAKSEANDLERRIRGALA